MTLLAHCWLIARQLLQRTFPTSHAELATALGFEPQPISGPGLNNVIREIVQLLFACHGARITRGSAGLTLQAQCHNLQNHDAH